MLGLPRQVLACLFDLDGVLTDTARVHRAAWRQTFDEVLGQRGLPPFTDLDYERYVDGKPRMDGVRAFLTSRGVHLPEGRPQDSPTEATWHGVGNRKNALLLWLLHRDGVAVYEGSRSYLDAVRRAGLRRAVVSSSANTAEVLRITGLDALVELQVDSQTLADQHLHGKPAPDFFLAAARLLGVQPAVAAVFEDALAGVQAGRAGGFGRVVGVNRADARHADALRQHGADVVVTDLSELLEQGSEG